MYTVSIKMRPEYLFGREDWYATQQSFETLGEALDFCKGYDNEVYDVVIYM